MNIKKLITRYGQFWERKDLFDVSKDGRVSWNDRGWPEKSPPFDGARGIYVLYRGTTPVYIGKAIRGRYALASRLRNHARGWLSHAWDNVSWFHFDDDVPNHVIDSMEALLIATMPYTLNGTAPRHLGKCCRPGNDKTYARNTMWRKTDDKPAA
jgi:hypothetical protein